jgi:hypothetical protein
VEQVECDGCGLQVRVRRDGTVSEHHYTRRRIKIRCARSGTGYSRHSCSFRIVTRDPKLWLAECRCGQSWTGAKYEDVERPWEAHVAEVQPP